MPCNTRSIILRKCIIKLSLFIKYTDVESFNCTSIILLLQKRCTTYWCIAKLSNSKYTSFSVDPNSGTIQQHVLSEPSQPQGGSSHQQNSGASSLSSSHCISCHSPLTPSNLRRDGGTLAMCDTCAKYTNMNGIRGGPTGSSNLVGVRSSGSSRRVSSSVSI